MYSCCVTVCKKFQSFLPCKLFITILRCNYLVVHCTVRTASVHCWMDCACLIALYHLLTLALYVLTLPIYRKYKMQKLCLIIMLKAWNRNVNITHILGKFYFQCCNNCGLSNIAIYENMDFIQNSSSTRMVLKVFLQRTYITCTVNFRKRNNRLKIMWNYGSS